MKDNEAGAMRGAGCEGLAGEALERHLFVCPACRSDVHLSAVWDILREGPSAPAGEAFVARVVRGVRRERVQERRWRLLLAAAAVLLFFFAAGANSGGGAAATSPAEDVYAGMATPSPALEGLLPE